jgi:hypothetical protein
MTKVVGFVLREQDEAHLQRLSTKLGWTRSQIVRELLARAVVEAEPGIRVVLPSVLTAEVDEAHVG